MRECVNRTSGPSEAWSRRCALSIALAWLGFLALITGAIVVYPGGNWFDRTAPGHHFFANYFCDLTQPVSLSGVNNGLGALLAQLAMLCFAAALGGFFWLVPRYFEPRARIGAWVRGLGEAAVLGYVAVPFTPSIVFGNVHALLALVSGSLGISAALCAVWALLRSSRAPRALGVVGAVALLTSFVHAVLFVLVQYWHAGEPLSLLIPGVQKLAAAVLSGWLLYLAWLTLSRRRESDR